MLREHGEAQQVDIHCQTNLGQPDLVRLLERGDAAFGCFITCRDTGLRRLQRFGFPAGSHQFAPGALLGRVQLRPMVWATRPIKAYAPAGADQEFGGAIDVEPGQILALDDEQRVDVLRPAIPAIESIFEIYASQEVEEGDFEIDTSNDRIKVYMGEKTFALVQSLRGAENSTKCVVMNALYVPILMEVLHLLSSGAEEYEQHRWYEPFRKRCELLDVDIEADQLLTNAQRLLDRPFAKLEQLVAAAEEEVDA